MQTRDGGPRTGLTALTMTLALAAGTIADTPPTPADPEQPPARFALEQADGRVRVLLNGDLFTEYVHADTPRPMLYPVIGPHGIPMTRNFPMRRVPGEASDHPHHRSLWFAHGDVNGIDFWADGDNRGRIVHEAILATEASPNGAVITARNRWVAPDGRTVCTDERTMRFSGTPSARCIDIAITLIASEGELRLGDTKEGTMAIRMHPNLRLRNDPGRGVTTANGKAINSEGQRDGDLWGKRARWIDYHGQIDGKTVGIAIFDHPDNPRHPTWWHARDYGLVAANPLGIHDFERKPAGTGDMVIPAGERVTFRWRFVFHEGDAETADIEGMYDAWLRQNDE